MIDLRIDIRKDPDIQKLPEDVQTKLSDFIDSIPKVKFFKPDGKPKKEWKVFYGDTWASARAEARDATHAAIGASARTSAWESARDAATDSRRTYARSSAMIFAEDSARLPIKTFTKNSTEDLTSDSARVSAKDSARDFTRDFELKAEQIVVSDLNYEDKVKHEHDIDERIEVWKKGYGLFNDVNGVLYVYAKKGTKPLLS